MSGFYWITTSDNSINFRTEAESSDDAFEILAHKLDYVDYQSMCVDLGYTGNSFSVAVLADGRVPYDSSGSRKHIDRQRDNVVKNAFKHLRRAG